MRRETRSLGRFLKADLLAFPADVLNNMGHALGVAQLGGKHPGAKPWKGEGAGVFEIVESFDGSAYRTIYTVRFEGFVYVLHAFQKKSPPGIRTAQTDIDLVSERFKRAREHFETTHRPTPKGKTGKHGK
jgi:phage-related protein